ncbi:MAG: hypothetical protein RR406_01705 [Bacilli bacterium]
MEQVVMFILTFGTVYLLYYVFTIRREQRKDKKIKKSSKIGKNKRSIVRTSSDKKDNMPVEVQYLVLKYKLDLKDFNYDKFLHVIAVVTSFDIAIAVTIVSLLKGAVWQLLGGFFLLIPLILISFNIMGSIYQKKGSKKNV